MKKLLLFIGVMFLFSGCATTPYYVSVSKVKNVEAQRDRVIVTDILNFVRGYYPPARTQFYIDTKFTPATRAFSDLLEQKFRGVGYGITYDEKSVTPYAVSAWKIDYIGSQTVRATFVVDNATISRLYKKVGNSYVPITPYTVRGLSSTPPYKQLSFLKSSSSSSLSRARSTGGLLTRIIATSLNVRKKPNTHSKILRTYKKGTYLRVSKKVKNSQSEYWYKLKNYSGFVSADYVKVVRR